MSHPLSVPADNGLASIQDGDDPVQGPSAATENIPVRPEMSPPADRGVGLGLPRRDRCGMLWPYGCLGTCPPPERLS